MLSYVGKLIHTVLPSVLATVLGAYLVNFYILPKPAVDLPAAAVSAPAKPEPASLRLKPADVATPPKAGEAKAGEAKTGDAKASETKSTDTKPSEPASRAKPSEKQVDDKRRPDRPQDKAAEKSERPDEPADARKIQGRDNRDKAAARNPAAAPHAVSMPAAVAPAAVPATVAVVSPASAAAAVDPALTPEQRRDANDLARAAIDRLRTAKEPLKDNNANSDAGPSDAASAPPRERDAAPVVVATPAPPPSMMQPLPPAITVLETPAEPYVARRESQERSSGEFIARADGSRDLRPPASIPESSQPINLHGDVERPSVADDVMSAAKSVFQSVIPGR